MKQNPENQRWFYESLVPSSITDPAEREAYIQRLMQEGVNSKDEGGEKLEYFTE